MRPADGPAGTPPSWSATVMMVLLKEACTVATACGMFFFSFFAARGRFPFAPLTGFSGVADAGVGSAISFLSEGVDSRQSAVHSALLVPPVDCRLLTADSFHLLLRGFLLAGDRLFAGALAGAGARARALPPHREISPVAHSPAAPSV